MSLRFGHGKGTGSPRVEVLPPDELPAPVAVERGQGGRLATSEAARVLGRKGGATKARHVRLARSLGLAGSITDAPAFAPYRRSASAFRRYHCAELARMAGGHCGAGPASLVASAALQVAASRYLFEQGGRTGDVATLKTASQIANDSRQNLLAAYELAVRAGQARKSAAPHPGLAALQDPPIAPRPGLLYPEEE